jgi:hypothetical protein
MVVMVVMVVMMRHQVVAAARQLLDVVDGVEAADSGQFWAWDGARLPW